MEAGTTKRSVGICARVAVAAVGFLITGNLDFISIFGNAMHFNSRKCNKNTHDQTKNKNCRYEITY